MAWLPLVAALLGGGVLGAVVLEGLRHINACPHDWRVLSRTVVLIVCAKCGKVDLREMAGSPEPRSLAEADEDKN